MTTLNATAKDWSCEITVLDSAKNAISGPHDFSDAVRDVEINFPEISVRNSPNSWISWTASGCTKAFSD